MNNDSSIEYGLEPIGSHDLPLAIDEINKKIEECKKRIEETETDLKIIEDTSPAYENADEVKRELDEQWTQLVLHELPRLEKRMKQLTKESMQEPIESHDLISKKIEECKKKIKETERDLEMIQGYVNADEQGAFSRLKRELDEQLTQLVFQELPPLEKRMEELTKESTSANPDRDADKSLTRRRLPCVTPAREETSLLTMESSEEELDEVKTEIQHYEDPVKTIDEDLDANASGLQYQQKKELKSRYNKKLTVLKEKRETLTKKRAEIEKSRGDIEKYLDENRSKLGLASRRLACVTPAHEETCAIAPPQGSDHTTLIGMSVLFLIFMFFIRRWTAKSNRRF